MDSTDSERFADEAEKPIPPKNTWEDLSSNQLIELKLQLEDKLWSFGKVPIIANTLREGIKRVTELLDSRTS